MQREETGIFKLAAVVLVGVAAILIAVVFGGTIWSLISPFLFAWAISLAARPLSKFLYRKTKIPQKLWAAVLIILLVAGVLWGVAWGISRAWEELTEFLSRFGEGESPSDGIINTVGDVLGNVTRFLPLPESLRESPSLADFWSRLDSALEETVMSVVSAACQRIPAIAMAVAKAVPSIFLFLTVALMSSYYFSVSERSAWRTLVGLAGGEESALGGRLDRLGTRVTYAAKRYARAYLLLMLITFVEMFIGFCVIGVKYAFLLASVVAIVDFLPVLGAGTVLVPWAVVSFINGDVRTGAGLLIIFGVSLIVRQIAEPKIVGASLGLHPFVSLAAVYIGFVLFGFAGMLLAPAVAMLFAGAGLNEENHP